MAIEPEWRARTKTNLLAARNGRFGHRKSRNGCRICKDRKVKCDETRPCCKRCTDSGFRCTGYQIEGQTIAAPSLQKPGAIVPATVALEAKDRRTFDHFVTVTAPKLAGALDRELWYGHVLQLAHAEPFVRDSLLAISTLYEHPQYLATFTPSHGTSDKGGMITQQALRPDQLQDQHMLDQFHADALRHYNRALVALKEKLSTSEASPIHALLSCVLFICIEVIRDNAFGALALFEKGRGLLWQFRNVHLSGQEQTLFELLRLMFTRLGAMAATFGPARPMEWALSITTHEIPDTFASLTEARAVLYLMMGEGYKFIAEWQLYKLSTAVVDSTCSSRHDSTIGVASPALSEQLFEKQAGRDHAAHYSLEQPYHVRDRDKQDVRAMVHEDASDSDSESVGPQVRPLAQLLQRQCALFTQFERWHNAFKHFETETSHAQPGVASSLLLYYYTSSTWLAGCTPRPFEMQFDNHVQTFRDILHHAQAYLEAQSIEGAAFTLEFGMIPPLAFVATKCRVPSLRRMALSLMSRAPRKESVWGATTTAQALSKIIALEEEGLGLPPPSWTDSHTPLTLPGDDTKLPCADQRVHAFEILKDTTGCFEIRTTRMRMKDGQLVLILEDFPI